MVPDSIHAAMRGPTVSRIMMAPDARAIMGTTPLSKSSSHVNL